MDKKTVRREINQFFNRISHKDLAKCSLDTSKILMHHKIWKESDIILAFLTFGKEFETDHLIKEALQSGKKVAVPRIYGKEMKFHYISSLDDEFEINRWMIREPLSEVDFWTPADGDALMLTPGLAFNSKGGRLGRGGGFYDRFLSTRGKNLFTVALCFEKQIREDFPVEPRDYTIDSVCSNERILIF